MYFIWANAVVLTAGRLPPIQIRDLSPLRPSETAEPSRREVALLWEAEQQTARLVGRPPSLLVALMRFLWRDEALTLTFKLCCWLVASMISNAVLLPLLIRSFSDGSPVWQGYIIAFLFLVTEGARSLFVSHHWYIAVAAAMRLRGALRLLISEKSLLIAGGGGPSTGKAVILITADCNRMLEAMSYFQFTISAPVTLIATFAVMWSILGPSALV